jgi:hypothetical protein
MRAQGMRAFEIVKATGISRRPVDKWLRLDECPPQGKMAPRPGMAESFREELQQHWDQGCQNGKQLFAEMRQRGYIGTGASETSEPIRSCCEEQRGGLETEISIPRRAIVLSEVKRLWFEPL